MESNPAESSQHIVNKHLRKISADSVAGLTRYLAEVLTWTREIPLVSRRDPAAACERLLLESLELSELLGIENETIVDIGSGAGFPGLVWALQNPSLKILLIERRERKAAFLERIARALQLQKVEVFLGEARTAARTENWRGQFSLAVTMAVGDPIEIARQIDGMLSPGARFASTLSHDSAPAGQPAFELVSTTAGEYGRYAVYRFRV